MNKLRRMVGEFRWPAAEIRAAIVGAALALLFGWSILPGRPHKVHHGYNFDMRLGR